LTSRDNPVFEVGERIKIPLRENAYNVSLSLRGID